MNRMDELKDRLRNRDRLIANQHLSRVIDTFTDEQLKYVSNNLPAFQKVIEKAMVEFLPERSDKLVVEVDFSQNFFELMEKAGLKFQWLPYDYQRVVAIPKPQLERVKQVDVFLENMQGSWLRHTHYIISSKRLEFCHPLVLPNLALQYPAEVKGTSLFVDWDRAGWKEGGWRISITSGYARLCEYQCDLEAHGRAVTTLL